MSNEFFSSDWKTKEAHVKHSHKFKWGAKATIESGVEWWQWWWQAQFFFAFVQNWVQQVMHWANFKFVVVAIFDNFLNWRRHAIDSSVINHRREFLECIFKIIWLTIFCNPWSWEENKHLPGNENPIFGKNTFNSQKIITQNVNIVFKFLGRVETFLRHILCERYEIFHFNHQTKIITNIN